MPPDVRLRPVTDADLDALLALRAPGVRSPYDDFGHFAAKPERLLQRWAETRLLGEDQGSLVIEADGEFAGEVQWHAEQYGPPPASRCWNVGITVRPELRGRGIGTLAQRRLADYLFLHTAVNRVEASTDVTNVAEQRALEKAGFTREGVARGAQWRRGAWHDLVVYGRLRADP